MSFVHQTSDGDRSVRCCLHKLPIGFSTQQTLIEQAPAHMRRQDRSINRLKLGKALSNKMSSTSVNHVVAKPEQLPQPYTGSTHKHRMCMLHADTRQM